jgi:hypothetical protein
MSTHLHIDVVIVMDQAPLKPVRRVKWKSAASASHHTPILTDDTRVIPSADVIEVEWILLDAGKIMTCSLDQTTSMSYGTSSMMVG